jgi:hypothetical protein
LPTTMMRVNSSTLAAPGPACRAPNYRLSEMLQPLRVSKMPLNAPPPRTTRFGSPLILSRVHWGRPELVCEVRFLTWTVRVELAEGHYDRYDYLPERRASMAKWGTYLDRVLAGKITEVGQRGRGDRPRGGARGRDGRSRSLRDGGVQRQRVRRRASQARLGGARACSAAAASAPRVTRRRLISARHSDHFDGRGATSLSHGNTVAPTDPVP